ncbi:long-chain fatty acid--CoA ligase [Actinomadura craniellae]|uniref:Long-chain fatty acid--CoA ligase n=2 Tax=Actinomadura craniellae TaxID=2231787 RepID=A0A365HEA5_9ACTN|nr:long-chain fatty acid--CoA ligase [Actinomadura craniellae]
MLSADLRALLTGPGGPFERALEPVLGAPAEVFVQRAPHLPAVLDGAAGRTPDAPYLVAGERTLTYAGAARLARAYAAVLAGEYGVGKGDRVAVAAPNSPEYLLAFWATTALGAILTGLNGWWTPAELDHGIELTGPVVVFGAGRPLQRLHECGAAATIRIADLADLADLAGAAERLDSPADWPAAVIEEDDPAAIMFTSGTTGRPKGAVLSHRNMVHFGLFGGLGGAVAALAGGADGRQVPPGVQRATLLSNPLFHVSGACVALSTAPLFGTKLVLPPPGRWSEETALRLTHEHRLTQWSGVPTHFWRMLTHPDFDSYETGQVATIGSGGSTFAPELLRLIEEKMPGVQVTNGYGMTETTGAGTFLNAQKMDTHPASVGAAAPTMKVQVRDAAGTALPEGEVGEVHLAGAGVFLGYWRDPAATRDVLDDGRWYRTGDYGRIVDGVLYLESRMRDMIIRGGENIYPIEIEYRLVEHPDIDDAAVIGVPDTVLGQEVKAFVVCRRGAELDAGQVRDWVAGALAAFKVPARVEFRDALPYSQTGKVLKRELEGSPA